MRGHKRIDKLVNRKSFEKISGYTIVNLNEDGRIEDWNDSAIKILGYKPKEVKGSSFKIFFNDRENETRKFGKLIDKAIKFGKTSSQTVLVKKDNTTFSANILINSIYDDDHHVIGFSVIVGEVTVPANGSALKQSNHHYNGHDSAQQKLEKLTKEFEMISTSLSHDLRAPLRAIEGYLGIMEEDYSKQLSDEGNRILLSMHKNSRKMFSLIENLVSFSRVCTRELKLSKFDTSEVVENILQEIRSGQNGEINIQVQKLPVIKADHSLISVALTHLISNAIKFTSKTNHAEIRISSEIREQNIIFIVQDNGVGFEMTYSGKLFETFHRLHSESDFEGAGIGLAIVKLIADKHHGKVWANAEPNNGATFYLSLPLID